MSATRILGDRRNADGLWPAAERAGVPVSLAAAMFLPTVRRFVFEPQTFCIQEIRPYAAAPIHPDMTRQELRDFDYAGRGYPTTFP
jgi:hypothetical protein